MFVTESLYPTTLRNHVANDVAGPTQTSYIFCAAKHPAYLDYDSYGDTGGGGGGGEKGGQHGQHSSYID